MLPRLAANQKAIRVIKADSNKDNTYTIYNLAATRKAMKDLNPTAFKVWCYFNSNAGGYEFGLSSKDVCEACGISWKTYQAAIASLIEKGYLVQEELYNNLMGYLFIEDADGGDSKKLENFHGGSEKITEEIL